MASVSNRIAISEAGPRLAVIRSRPRVCTFIILSVDIAAFALAFSFSVWFRHVFRGHYDLLSYARLWPALALFAAAYALFGLYPGVTASVVDEMRRTACVTTLVFLVLATFTFVFCEGERYSRAAFLLGWLTSLVLVPAARCLVRRRMATRPWWGVQVLILGAGETGRRLTRTLIGQPELGVRPRAVLDVGRSAEACHIDGVPVLRDGEAALCLAHELGISHAIVVLPDVSRRQLPQVLDSAGQTFAHLWIVSDLYGIGSLGTEARDLHGTLALEVRRNLLLPGRLAGKAVMDVGMALVLGLFLLLPMILIAVLIKLDSPGPVVCGSRRIGRNGIRFQLWKFRTTVPGTAGTFRRTWIGRILHKTSLDELPQLWNVLTRDMSMVGPRPIGDADVERYGLGFTLYSQVTPGVTGLWQVSERGAGSYAERVLLDAYYVRNWSVWLDIYVLARTLNVVLQGRGASGPLRTSVLS